MSSCSPTGRSHRRGEAASTRTLLPVFQVVEPLLVGGGDVFESLDGVQGDFEVSGHLVEALFVFVLHAGEDFEVHAEGFKALVDIQAGSFP
jgi:hypothetical protein